MTDVIKAPGGDFGNPTATNGRLEATDILAARDALIAAASAAKRAVQAGVDFELVDDDHPDADGARGYHRDRALLNAQLAQTLAVYAATVGGWAAR